MEIYGNDRGTTLAKIKSSSKSKVTGPGASAVKYDILTALLVTAGRDGGATARLAARLALVITARFNWRLGHFNVGLKELARMWGVTERTAKREMAQMRQLGWISVERSAARGRVAQHRIEFETLLRSTAPHWEAVGPDFAARMSGVPEVAPKTNVVSLHAQTVSVPAEDGSDWPAVAQLLRDHDPGLYGSWFASLALLDTENGVWTFLAPSRFAARYIETHLKPRMLHMISTVDRSARDVKVVAEDK